MSSERQMESISCPICSSDEGSIAYSFPPYYVRHCRECGFFFLSPRLTQAAILQIYRQETYFSSESEGYTSYKDQEFTLRRTFRKFLSNLERRGLTRGRLLEIGCGYGYLIDEARKFFNERVATDFSAQAIAIAKRYADRVYQGDIANVPSGEMFDCIIATHVIEHTYQPKKFIDSLIDRLSPGGRLILAAPNMGGFWRFIMGHRWPSFKIPEHVLYFDRHSLTRLLRECGLQEVNTLPYPHAFPLSLVASKFNIPIPSSLANLTLWLPATTITAYGVRKND